MGGPPFATRRTLPAQLPMERQTVESHAPALLCKMLAVCARKHGQGDWLMNEMEQMERIGAHDPFLNTVRQDESGSNEQERDRRREDKVARRKQSATSCGMIPAQDDIDGEPSDGPGVPLSADASNATGSPKPVSLSPTSPVRSKAAPTVFDDVFLPERQRMNGKTARNEKGKHKGLDGLPLPAWYDRVNTFEMNKLKKKTPNALRALQSLKGCIDRCEDPGRSGANPQDLFERLRDRIHRAGILLRVDKYVLKAARILEQQHGLPRIFGTASKIEFPWDVKVDAWELYTRWCDPSEDFNLDLLRGIYRTKGLDRGSDRIIKGYLGKKNADYYGEGHLVLGQWWPTQLCTVRDGAHGSTQGGIYGVEGRGVFSIVLSGSQYDDVDEGEEIWYSGTDGSCGTAKENTHHMVYTCKVKNPIRLIRSHQAKKSKYRPEVGFRYDGLYEIKEYELVDPEKAAYKFHLIRCPGQFPIRCEDNTAKRPTKYEIEAFENLKGLR